MTDTDYLERQSQELLEEIDSTLYSTDDFDPLLLKVRWEIARLREIVYDQTIELGLREWEINQLKQQLKG